MSFSHVFSGWVGVAVWKQNSSHCSNHWRWRNLQWKIHLPRLSYMYSSAHETKVFEISNTQKRKKLAQVFHFHPFPSVFSHPPFFLLKKPESRLVTLGKLTWRKDPQRWKASAFNSFTSVRSTEVKDPQWAKAPCPWHSGVCGGFRK